METISRIASEFPLLSKGEVTGDKQLPSSVHEFVFNDDLLLEILLRLPVISLSRFRYVSKRWLSLIRDPYFTLRGIQNNNLYPPSALLLWQYKACFGYDFLPLNSRILPSGSRFQTISKFGCVSTKFKILQSCNGLLLCSSSHDKLYHVYNPSIHIFTTLAQPHIRHLMFDTTYGGVKLAFDPTKSPHYKVIHARNIYSDDDDDDDVYIQIQTYFSGTHNWIICGGLYPYEDFECFDNGIYWNGAIHWLKERVYTLPLHSKLDIVDPPVLTTMLLKLPLTFNGLVHCNVKLFESCGCLLLLYWDYTRPQQLNIYEMRNGHSEWSEKYVVNLNNIMNLFPKTWIICPTVCCIALGGREEDSFMVMQLFGKLVQYKIVIQTVHTLCNLGSASLHERLTVMSSFAGV